jgi:hypothetical protein
VVADLPVRLLGLLMQLGNFSTGLVGKAFDFGELLRRGCHGLCGGIQIIFLTSKAMFQFTNTFRISCLLLAEFSQPGTKHAMALFGVADSAFAGGQSSIKFKSSFLSLVTLQFCVLRLFVEAMKL